MKTSTLVIKNGSVVTPTELIPSGAVHISGDRITYVGSQQEAPASQDDVTTIDALGGIICPGFIDLHVNGGGGRDITEASRDAIEGIAEGHARCGTTGFLVAVTGPNEAKALKGLEAAADVAEGDVQGARLFGIHMEGPYVNPARQGPVFREFHGVEHVDMDLLSQFIDRGRGWLKIVTLAPEIEGVLRAYELLVERGVIASIGHTEANATQVADAIRAGASYAAHIFNAMSGVDHREPGAATGILASDSDFKVELIADGHHVHPDAVRLLLAAKGLESVILVSDATELVGSSRTSFVLPIGDGFKVVAKDGRTWGPDGQLIGSILQLNHAVRNLVTWFGLDVAEVVKSATIRPAETIGVDEHYGSLEVGKKADLVLLNPNWEVHQTIVDGKVVFAAGDPGS